MNKENESTYRKLSVEVQQHLLQSLPDFAMLRSTMKYSPSLYYKVPNN